MLEQPIITYAENTLWGIAGGQLEYVGQRLEWRKRELADGKAHHFQVMILRFTDHDVRISPAGYLVNGGQYYELEFPLEEGG